jgi:hypothetical protein
VPLTTDYEGDEASALELIAIQFLRIAHRYWDGWVETDADFEERLRDRLRYAADLREAERIEREVAVNFVNLLLNDGYETVADTFGNHFVLVDSSARDDLVESFFDNLGIPEYAVTKHGAEHRFRIGSGGPANFIKTDSNAIGALIRPLVEPYVANAQSVAASGEEIENFEETSAGTQGAAP